MNRPDNLGKNSSNSQNLVTLSFSEDILKDKNQNNGPVFSPEKYSIFHCEPKLCSNNTHKVYTTISLQFHHFAIKGY